MNIYPHNIHATEQTVRTLDVGPRWR